MSLGKSLTTVTEEIISLFEEIFSQFEEILSQFEEILSQFEEIFSNEFLLSTYHEYEKRGYGGTLGHRNTGTPCATVTP